jgi:hypothetical protein
MIREELYAEFRELVGNPDPNDFSNRQIESYLVPAMEWLAVQLNYAIRTDSTLVLKADQVEYNLPEEFGSMIFVEWNAVRIQPSSVYQWDREGSDYRTAASANPREYAVLSRTLYLNPPPSSTAITTDPYLTLRYIGSSIPMDGGGAPQLGTLDQQLCLYRAAMRYCRSHPNEENRLRIEGYQAEIDELLPAARKRAQNAIEDYSSHFHPLIDRFGGAR